jgi:hypothetical protein
VGRFADRIAVYIDIGILRLDIFPMVDVTRQSGGLPIDGTLSFARAKAGKATRAELFRADGDASPISE